MFTSQRAAIVTKKSSALTKLAMIPFSNAQVSIINVSSTLLEVSRLLLLKRGEKQLLRIAATVF